VVGTTGAPLESGLVVRRWVARGPGCRVNPAPLGGFLIRPMRRDGQSPARERLMMPKPEPWAAYNTGALTQVDGRAD
jgi:hypothetical protein